MKRILIAVLLFIVCSLLWAQHPGLDPSPKAFEYARRISANGSWQDFAEAALWASLVYTENGAEEKAVIYMERMNKLIEELAAEDLPVGIKERGEFLLKFLHGKYLKTYSFTQSRIDVIFNTGRFNCVSSAVLYMICGLAIGLDVEGVKTEDHCFVTVNTDSGKVDVETTNKFGFQPGTRKEYMDTQRKMMGSSFTPLKDYKDRVEISKTELISLILNNRIAELEKKNRFIEAVPLAVNQTALLSGQTSGELLVSLQNLASHYINTGKEETALQWIDFARKHYPDEGWNELYYIAANNMINKLMRSKKINEAHAELNAMQPKLNYDNFRKIQDMVLEGEAAQKVNYGIKNPGDAEEVILFLEQNKERFGQKRFDELVNAAILNEAERIRKMKDYESGIRWLSASIGKYNTNKKVEAALGAFRQSRVIELHNIYVELVNKKDYSAAKLHLEASLQEFPGNRMLTQDLNKLMQISQ